MDHNNAKYLTLTDDNFEQEVLKSAKPVLVDFWAPWCAPCRAIAPMIEQLAQEFESQAIVGKMNVDEHQQVAARYGIQAIPTLMIFHNGKAVESMVGSATKSVLAESLQALIQPV